MVEKSETEDNQNKNLDKGKLIYSSPHCSTIRRGCVILVYTSMIGSGISMLLFGIFFRPELHIILLFIAILITLIFAAFLVSKSDLWPHFKIYENGISQLMLHYWHPFKKCDELEPTLGSFPNYLGEIDTIFVPWKNIACYEKQYWEDKDPKKKGLLHYVMIYLKNNKKLPYSKGSPVQYIYSNFFTDKGKLLWHGAMKQLVNNLKKNNIKEIPRKCPKCKEEVLPPHKNCPMCGYIRF
jgi:hypothetical protein